MKRGVVVNILDLLNKMEEYDASDLHIQSGKVPKLRVQGIMTDLNYLPLDDYAVDALITDMHPSDLVLGGYMDKKTTDFRFACTYGMYRVNISSCDGGRKITMRRLNKKVSNYTELGFEAGIFEKINTMKHGLILITGPTNSGKSTTLAAIITMLAQHNINIITLEDPIEYFLTGSGGTLITQRELGADFSDFPLAIKAALRQDPDVLMVGEMRDLETIKAGLLCAETGHLVLATLHTSDIPSTLSRIVLTFNLSERSYIQSLLQESLKCIIAQTLVYNEETKKLKLKYDYKFFDKNTDFNF